MKEAGPDQSTSQSASSEPEGLHHETSASLLSEHPMRSIVSLPRVRAEKSCAINLIR